MTDADAPPQTCIPQSTAYPNATMAVLEKARVAPSKPLPLQQGDMLTRGELERRYAAMPHIKKAELINGIVYMASPVRADVHGIPHVRQHIYHRAGVRGYLVWIADENRLVWWRIDDAFVEIPADADGTLTSQEFPGLVIDSAALATGNLATALGRLSWQEPPGSV